MRRCATRSEHRRRGARARLVSAGTFAPTATDCGGAWPTGASSSRPRRRGRSIGHREGRPSGGRCGWTDARRQALLAIAAMLDERQFEMISREESGLVVIQGSAGSGKTTVGLHRSPISRFETRSDSDRTECSSSFRTKLWSTTSLMFFLRSGSTEFGFDVRGPLFAPRVSRLPASSDENRRRHAARRLPSEIAKCHAARDRPAGLPGPS